MLADIYRGTITNWDDPLIRQLNKGVPLPSLPIRPVRRTDSSGDTFLFTSYLSTQDPGWDATTGYGTRAAWPHVAAGVNATSSTQVLHSCATTPGCVAYNGISFLSQAVQDNLGYASLANTVGKPTLGERESVIGATEGYSALETAITKAINADQAVFESAASSGSGTLGPLAGVVIATSVLMAVGSAWALPRRLAEYR